MTWGFSNLLSVCIISFELSSFNLKFPAFDEYSRLTKRLTSGHFVFTRSRKIDKKMIYKI